MEKILCRTEGVDDLVSFALQMSPLFYHEGHRFSSFSFKIFPMCFRTLVQELENTEKFPLCIMYSKSAVLLEKSCFDQF